MDHQLDIEKAGHKNKKKMAWSSEVLPYNQDDQDQVSNPSKDMTRVGGRLVEDRGMGTNARETECGIC